MKKRIKKECHLLCHLVKIFSGAEQLQLINVKAAIIREDVGLPMSTLFHTEKTVFQLLQGK